MDIISKLSQELNIRENQIKAAVELIDEGNTIPFIARYRKEVTGSLDDEQLRALNERLSYLRGLEKRKDEVRAAITEQEKMTEEIEDALVAAEILAEVEDIYRPYKQKRKTRASVARERGLLPLSELIFEQKDEYAEQIEKEAEKYIDEEKGVPDVKTAINGALDIIAENLIETNLHGFNAGFLFDFLLKVLHPGFVVGSNQMQLIQLLIITCANHAALTDRKRRLIDNRLL